MKPTDVAANPPVETQGILMHERVRRSGELAFAADIRPRKKTLLAPLRKSAANTSLRGRLRA
jgi:hypothetical protein